MSIDPNCPRVSRLLADAMEMHPGSDFYRVVHERLAQLARRLECENGELKRKMDTLLARQSRARRH